jgi:hypothetical protein
MCVCVCVCVIEDMMCVCVETEIEGWGLTERIWSVIVRERRDEG